MKHVDALSRAPLEVNHILKTETYFAHDITSNDIRDWQTKYNLKLGEGLFMKDEVISINIRNKTKALIPRECMNNVLKSFHDNVNHPGIARTNYKISQSLYWKNMKDDITSYIRTCHTCQMVKPANHSTYSPLIPIETPKTPYVLWAMDTIVMGSASNKTKAKYIQVIIDHHSRYVWAKATKTNTAQASIEVLQTAIKEVGPPERLLTDNGTNFKSNKFKKFLKEYHIKRSYTTSYHPQCNGMVEKVNDTITKGLKQALIDKPNFKWSTSLASVIKNYNNTIHTVTSFTPIYLLKAKDISIEELEESRRIAVDRSNKEKERSKHIYDKIHPKVNLNIGDLVKKRIPKNHPERHKLSPRYEGPFRVISKESEVNYKIQHVKNSAPVLTHVCQLEPFYLRDLHSSVVADVVTQRTALTPTINRVHIPFII